MTDLKITDSYGDTLSFEYLAYTGDDSPVVSVTGDQDGREATINLTPDSMVQVAVYLAEKAKLSAAEIPVDLDTLLSENRSTDRRESWNRVALETAAALDAGVTFRYAKGVGEASIESRVLSEVFDVREVKGHVVVTGFDPDRNDVRAYRLDRIKGTVQVDI